MKPLRPYLYHAYYQWIIECDNTPYLLIDANYPSVKVPQEFVNNDGKIILNISPTSIGQYVVDDKSIRFSARFHGALQHIYIPFGAMVAIYAKENGSGAIFEEEACYQSAEYLTEASHHKEEEKNAYPHLKLIK